MNEALTPEFRKRVEATGMTHSAIAAAMGLTKQFFSEVWNGTKPPSYRFMAGAVRAGLADHFGEVAQIAPEVASEVA